MVQVNPVERARGRSANMVFKDAITPGKLQLPLKRRQDIGPNLAI
jgi:hypothetical protein